MKRPLLQLLLAILLLASNRMSAADQPSLDSHLEPMRPLLEKTWKGPFADSKPEKPMHDVARWERALNGRAIRVLHSVNDGVYGGETIITWDEEKKRLVYHYFTTDGNDTTGTFVVKEGRFVSSETVHGEAGGVTEVRATTELLADGSMHTKADYLKDGKWVPGHEITYKEDATAKVIFK